MIFTASLHSTTKSIHTNNLTEGGEQGEAMHAHEEH